MFSVCYAASEIKGFKAPSDRLIFVLQRAAVSPLRGLDLVVFYGKGQTYTNQKIYARRDVFVGRDGGCRRELRA